MQTVELQKEERSIRHLLEEIISAFNEGNIEKAAALHTENVVLIESGMPHIQNRQALLTLFKDYFDTMKREQLTAHLSLAIHELQIAGSWAFVRGEVVLTKFKKENAPQQSKGRFLSIFQKQPQEGSWLRSHIASVSDP